MLCPSADVAAAATLGRYGFRYEAVVLNLEIPPRDRTPHMVDIKFMFI